MRRGLFVMVVCTLLPALAGGCAAVPLREVPNTVPPEPPPPSAPQEVPTGPPLLPPSVDDGPADGLTLEAAAERLLAADADLAARYQDIPKARADVLTAGLRNDPVLFLSATAIPYGQFSPQRPGGTRYDVTVVQALDVSGKHRTNTVVARKRVPVLEARYRDAVRRALDRLHTAYVNVLEAHALAWVEQTNLDTLTAAERMARGRVGREQLPPADLARVRLRRASAQVAARRAETALTHTRRNLGVLLALSPQEADCLRVRGALSDRLPPPPCAEELTRLALEERPDLTAHRLSVDRARAEVRREKAERVEDLFLFVSPYLSTDLSPQNKQSTNAWQVGILLPMPVFNRNQGEIARAQVNVAQWQIEVEKAEREVIDEVRQAAADCAASAEDVRRYEREIVPGARLLRDEQLRRFEEGAKGVGPFLSAQRAYHDAVRRYVEELVRHRRDMLRLNTTVGRRVLP